MQCILSLCVVPSEAPKPQRQPRERRRQGTANNNISNKSTHTTPWSQVLAHNRVFCLPHLHLMPQLGGSSSEYIHHVWYGKTRMVWLLDGEKFLKICLFVLTECKNVTDGQTPHDG